MPLNKDDLAALTAKFSALAEEIKPILAELAMATQVPALALKAREFASMADWVPRRVASAVRAEELAAENAEAAAKAGTEGVAFGAGTVKGE